MAGKTGRKETSGQIDFILLTVILSLILFGFIMLFSASSPSAAEGGIMRTLIRQGGILLLGLLILVGSASNNYHLYTRKRLISTLVKGAMAAMFLVPAIGFASHGATRQISLGPISFQPSEFAKIVLILFFASRFTTKETQDLKNDKKNILVCMGVMAYFCGTCFMQSHMSAAIIMAAISLAMMWIAGLSLPRKWLVGGGLGLLGIGAYFVLTEEYRINRFLALFDPFKYKQGIGWQIVQSLYAVASGGFFGLGLGQSRQKYKYLPEAQNDYIYAVVCEELGFVGGVIVILLFAVFVWRGISIALNAKDRFGMYVAFGITTIVGLQMLINIGVVLSILPSTGMQLPLFSSGGSSMIATMWGMGILLNISKNSKIKKV